MLNPALQSHDGRPTLRFERNFAHPPQVVWRALTEPAHVNQWFPFDAEMELVAGGKIYFSEKGAAEVAMEGLIVEFDPPHLLAYKWGDDLLRWELEPDDQGCRLIFTHTFDDHAGAASFAAGWQTCLDAMELVLAGETINPVDYVGPDWSRQMAERHERNVKLFGLHKGCVIQRESGWQVRFERQLTQPIDKVWAMLTAYSTTPVAGSTPPPTCTTQQVPAGTITEVDAPNVLAYEWLHEGRVAGDVRWSLGPGTGHGARLTLTQSGPDNLAAQQSIALDAWEQHIEDLAKQVLDLYANAQQVSS